MKQYKQTSEPCKQSPCSYDVVISVYIYHIAVTFFMTMSNSGIGETSSLGRVKDQSVSPMCTKKEIEAWLPFVVTASDGCGCKGNCGNLVRKRSSESESGSRDSANINIAFLFVIADWLNSQRASSPPVARGDVTSSRQNNVWIRVFLGGQLIKMSDKRWARSSI